MRILGIDPGTATTGYGLVEQNGNGMSLINFGWIETDKKHEAAKRLENIYGEMISVLTKEKPDVLAMEKLFFFANAKTAIRVSQAQGVILLAAQHSNVPVFEFSPLQVKKIVSGNGWAKKDQIKKVVKAILRFRAPAHKKTHFDDVADALAVAICYVKMGELKEEVMTNGRR